MKTHLLVVALLSCAGVVNGACGPTNLTNVVRIRTFDCNAQTANPLRVKIIPLKGNADKNDGGYFEATKAPGTDYWQITVNHWINAQDYQIKIPSGQGLADCCQSATEKLISPHNKDCYVDYIVSCDKPEWGINVASTPQLTFDYERDHPDGFDGWACTKTAQVSGTVTGFGASDQVRLLLRLNNISVLNYPISLSILQQKPVIPLTRHDLELLIDAEAKRAAVNDTPAARVAVQTRKKLLPDMITLTKTNP